MFPYNITLSLLLEYLKSNYSGQFANVVNGVVELAVDKRLINGPATPQEKLQYFNADYRQFLVGADRQDVPELIRQLMWRLLLQDVIVFGMDESNPNWPWYRVTGYGDKILQEQKMQPYDPDGFLREFRNDNPTVDTLIYEYLEEAVRTFNHDCPKSASVMLGAASEKAILILYDTFLNAISDVNKKTRFERDANWTISSKFNVLQDRLQRMINARKFDRDTKDIIEGSFPSLFNLIRKHRNNAGHPELFSDVSKDTIFLNLRIFSTYISDIYKLINHFTTNTADW